MFDLSAFRLQDMALCSTTIRQLGEGATSLGHVADRITRFLYTNLTTGPDEDPACVLVRAFKTHPYHRLAPELQALVDARLGGPPALPDMKCLTLLGSTGAVPGWNNPALSSRFRVIPLAGPETLEQLPMFAQLFAQFHINLPYLQETPVSLLLDKHATTFNAFYVPQAVDSPYVPGQKDFVIPFGVQSVFGYGGLLPTGDMFALILFSKIAVSKETADLFKTIALSVKLALSPFENPQLILPAATAASGTIQQPATLNDLQDRVATLEAILAVQEQAVDVQSRRLEDNLSEAIRQGQKLQKQSVRFETLAATSPVGIFETDADGACLYTNAAWQAIAGVTLADTLGDGWSRTILEEDRPRVCAAWSQTAKTGEDFSLEFRMQRSEGTIRWVHARSRPLKNEAGQIIGHVGTTEDITERKQTEAVLHAQRQQLQAIVDGTSDAVFIKDLQGKYLLFNEAGARFVGKQPTDVIGLDDTSLFPPDEARTVMEGDRRVMAGGKILTYEDHVTTPDGVRRTFSSTKGPLFDQQGTVSGMFGISRDVTEQKRVEELTRQSEERYRRYFELGLIGMAVTSLEKGWIQVNDRLCEIFGYSQEELTAKTWAELTHPDDIAADVAQFNRVLAGEINGYSLDKRFIHQDGHVIYASISASAVRRPDGSIDHFVALVQDVTARHEAEQRLKSSERMLQRQIDEMPIGHIVWDHEFRVQSWNPAAERIFGYRTDEAIGRHGTFLIPEEYRPHTDELWQRLLAGDKTAHSVNDNLTKDGHRVICQWSNTPLQNSNGAVTGVLSMVVDVTERQRADEELRQSELRLTQATLAGHIGIFDHDHRTDTVYWSPTTREILGIPSDEVASLARFTECIHPEDRDTILHALQNAHAPSGEGVYCVTHRILRSDKAVRWVSVQSRTQFEETPSIRRAVRTTGTIIDITDRKQAEEAIRTSEARLKEAQALAHIGTWELDLRTNHLIWSDEIFQIFEIDPAKFHASYDGFLQVIHPDDRALVNEAYTQSVQGHTPYEITHRLLLPDGRIKHVHERGMTHYDDSGQPLVSIGTVQDITDIKQGELEIAHARQLLQTVINTAPIRVFWKDRDSRYLGGNVLFAQDAGLSSPDELIGKRDADLVWKEQAALYCDDDRHVIDTGSVKLNFEEPQTIHTGETVWLRTSKVPLRDSGGHIVGVLGVYDDITRQKSAEEARSHAQALTEAIASAQSKLITNRPTHEVFNSLLDNLLTLTQSEYGFIGEVLHTPEGAPYLHTHAITNIAWDEATRAFYEKRAPNFDFFNLKTLFGHVMTSQSPVIANNPATDPRRGGLPPGHPPLRAFLGIPILFGERMIGMVGIANRPHGYDETLITYLQPFLITCAQLINHQRTTQALESVRSLHRAVLADAGHAIIATDLAGLITVFNPAAEQLLGYSAEEMIGKQTPAIFHDHNEVVARAAEFGAGLGTTITPGFDVFVEKARRNLPNQHEWTYIRQDGRRIPVMLSVAALRDSSGTITGYIAMALDLTDRNAADAQFQMVMEAMPTGIILVDETGRITMVNQHVDRMFGYKPGELLGQPVEILLPERFRATHQTHVRTFFRSPTARAMGAGKDLSGLRKDGTEFFLEIGLAPIHTPQGVRIVASITDITKRKQMESTRFRLQQAVNHAQDGMALLDESGEFTYMNPAYASTYGYTVDQLLGTNWKKLYPEEWAAMIEQMYLPTLRSEGQWQGEVVGEKISGEAFHVDLSLSLLEEPGTGHQTILSTCRDITARKRMEQELIGAKDAAEAGMRTKSEFLATMSHEIRTPMNGVLGMTGLLLDTPLTPEQQDYARTLKHSGESLMRIINDILDFSKIESGKMTIERIPFDLRLMIEGTLELLAPGAQNKQLELVGLIAASLPTAVIGDPGRIRQILTNLIGNAIKFTDRGEVLVQVMPVDDESSTLKLRFEIIDTGVGLDAEAQAKLFQSFTQADSSTARKYGGTGLGLAICKRLAELMGGNIGMYSIPGTGTCVWFTILLEAQAESSSPAVLHVIDNLKGLRICLVDDNATNRSLLQYHASAWEMPYDSAEDGAAALLLLKQAARDGRPFDLAIIDMHMPGMDGMQLAHAIKEDPSLSHTKLVLLTSLGRRGDAKLAQAAGFSGYLTKPVRKAHLYDCLRLVMGQAPATLVPEGAEQADSALITRHQIAELHAQVKLLVVDDNLINQKVAVKMLEKMGYRPDVAANGNEALLALSRHSYDLVFMDCQMPELDGFETTRMIRAQETAGRRLPVIAMTANAMEGDREHCLSSGMDDFVSKPVKSQELQRVLTQWLHPPDDRAAA